MTPSEAVSDSSGLAATTWTLGATLGTQTMTARVATVAGLELETVTATALPVTGLAASGSPYGLAVNANGLVYATLLTAGRVAVSSTTSKQLTTTIPRRLGLSGDGQTLVIANQYGWIDFVP